MVVQVGRRQREGTKGKVSKYKGKLLGRRIREVVIMSDNYGQFRLLGFWGLINVSCIVLSISIPLIKIKQL